LEEVVSKLHSTIQGKSLWIFFLAVQLHYAINQRFFVAPLLKMTEIENGAKNRAPCRCNTNLRQNPLSVGRQSRKNRLYYH
jgi:hypothetical protein